MASQAFESLQEENRKKVDAKAELKKYVER